MSELDEICATLAELSFRQEALGWRLAALERRICQERRRLEAACARAQGRPVAPPTEPGISPGTS